MNSTERGTPFEPFKATHQYRELPLTKSEVAAMDFRTLPVGVKIAVDAVPLEGINAEIWRSGSALSVTVLVPEDDRSPSARVTTNSLTEAARDLGFRGYRRPARVRFWIKRFKRGDEVLAEIAESWREITQRAIELHVQVAEEHRAALAID